MLPLQILQGHCWGDLASTKVVTSTIEVTVEDVQRILDLGKILRSVLTEKELLQLEKSIQENREKLGNTGDS